MNDRADGGGAPAAISAFRAARRAAVVRRAPRLAAADRPAPPPPSDPADALAQATATAAQVRDAQLRLSERLRGSGAARPPPWLLDGYSKFAACCAPPRRAVAADGSVGGPGKLRSMVETGGGRYARVGTAAEE